MKTSKNLLAGILLLCCSAFAGETVIHNGTQVIEKEAIATTTTDGLVLTNPTEATDGVPVQYSPSLRLRGHARDTSPSGNDTWDWKMEVRPTSSTTTSSILYLQASKGEAAYSGGFTVSSDGIFTATSISGGGIVNTSTNLTSAGVMTNIGAGLLKRSWHAYAWYNAMVVSGRTDATTSNVNIATYPANNVISRIIIKITGAATHADTVTVSAGRTGTDYIDYVVASDAKAAADTFYGDAIAEIGTNLKDSGATTPCEDFAGLSTSTTTFTAQFKCGAGADINTITGSTGVIYIETYELP